MTGDSHAHLLAPLCALARSLGYRVSAREPGAGGVQGWCDHQQREIVVSSQRPANARVRILVHELAHAHPAGELDYDHFGRDQAEVLVDTVTYVVCGQVGLDIEGESIHKSCKKLKCPFGLGRSTSPPADSRGPRVFAACLCCAARCARLRS